MKNKKESLLPESTFTADANTKDKINTPTEKSNKEKSKKVDTNDCPKCDTAASKRGSDLEGSIRCKICTFWWHHTCGGLGEKEYKLYLELAERGSPDLWQCLTCKVGMGDLGLRWEKTGKIVAENAARIDQLETKIDRLEAREDELETNLKETKAELEQLKKSIPGIKKEEMQRSLSELSERETKRNNVIIYKIPESTSNTPSDGQAHDVEQLQFIFRELGLSRFIKDDLREHIKLIRRIGEKKKQEARPIKLCFIFNSMKERLIESARYLNQLPALRHIGIGHDLTEIQRMEETSLWRKASNQNLAPTMDMQEKKLVMKVVGPRGRRRLIMAPLRRAEELDEEGRVRSG